ncbi:MAG: hypothetical protein ACT4NU_07405 [Chromatiales bacterium]
MTQRPRAARAEEIKWQITPQMTVASTPPRRLWRSTGAVLSGLAVFVLSLGTDQVLHALEVYPPWGQPMHNPGLDLLALAYRCVYAVVGSYIAARFAPRNPMRHALALGVVGFVLSLAGAITTIPMDLGPDWYPILLVLIALPCAWLGGVLQREAGRTLSSSPNTSR